MGRCGHKTDNEQCRWDAVSGLSRDRCWLHIGTSDKLQWDERQWIIFQVEVEHYLRECRKRDEVADLRQAVFPPFRWELRGEQPGLDLTRAEFLGDLDLGGSAFAGPFLLSDATCREMASFTKAAFQGRASFSSAKFEKGADFSGADFVDVADFGATHFQSQPAGFDGARFRKQVRFGAFQAGVLCRGARFYGEANFRGARISTIARFSGTHFGLEERAAVLFDHDVFDVVAEFEGCEFFGPALFRGVEFRVGADWTDGVRFHLFCAFDGAKFLGRTSFRGVEFRDQAWFNNTEFREGVSFVGSEFKQAPSFHEAALHQDTDFSGARFLDYRSPGAVSAYRTLKLKMEDFRARQEEADFYAYELRSRRLRRDTPPWVKLGAWLYEVSCDYGRDALKPLGLLLGLTGAASWIYWLIAASSGVGGQSVATWGALLGCMDFAVRQVVLPFDVWRDAARATTLFGSLSGLARYIGLVQSLASAVLIGLAVLCIRWRFRRG